MMGMGGKLTSNLKQFSAIFNTILSAQEWVDGEAWAAWAADAINYIERLNHFSMTDNRPELHLGYGESH